MSEAYDIGELGRPGGIGVRCQGVVHLYRTFEGHDVVALQGVDLSIAEGERVAFLGPSGSGKSTLLTLLGGIQKPSAGRIFLGDEEISRMGERFLARVAVLAEVQECHHVTGEFDYLLKVRCVGTRELEQLINDELKLESGVASSRTVVVLSTAKETTALPLPGASRTVAAGANARRRRR